MKGVKTGMANPDGRQKPGEEENQPMGGFLREDNHGY